MDLKENSYVPIANSNDKYSFHDDSEIAIIDALRDWSREHFSKFLIYPFETHLPEGEFGFDDCETKTVRSSKDFDILGKVTRIKRIDDTFATVWLKDLQGTLFEMTRVDTRKFPVIANEAVLRLRSLTLSRTQRRDTDIKTLIEESKSDMTASELSAFQLETNLHTNVLLFQPYFR